MSSTDIECRAVGTCRIADSRWPGNRSVRQTIAAISSRGSRGDHTAGIRPAQCGQPAAQTGAPTHSFMKVERRFGGMGAEVSWLLEVEVKPGQLDTFRDLMNEMVVSTRAEPGALSYEWFIGDDGRVVHLHERYADSAASLAHLGTFGEWFAGRFLAAVDPKRLTVMG